MSNLRLLFSLCSLVLVLAVVLARPLDARADDGETPPPSNPPPAGTDAILPPLPIVGLLPQRKPVALVRHVRRSLQLPFGDRVADFARHLVGVRYVYGGTSPMTGFDCSGLVRYVFGHFGVSLAHSSFAQFLRGRSVGRTGLEPGDLVFFDELGHVGIYIGHGRFIHAPHTGSRVQIQTLSGWYGTRFDGARRVRAT